MNPISEEEVRGVFPRMPAEVFDLWLSPEIARQGWPSFAEQTILLHSTWQTFLKWRPPSFWAIVTWSKKTVVAKELPLESQDVQRIADLIEQWQAFRETGHWRPDQIQDSPARILRAIKHIEKCGTVPRQLICFEGEHYWRLLDGFHRLVALHSLGAAETPVEIWLGQNAL